MTSKAPQKKSGSAPDTRLEELLRADAAAIADDDLDDTSGYSTPAAGDAGLAAAHQTRSQVYSIRVPVERLEEVRQLANGRGIPPTAMLRQWVLTRLDTELRSPGHPSQATEPQKARSGQHASKQRRDAEADRLETATTALIDVAAQLTKTVALFAELIAGQSATPVAAPAPIRALPPQPGIGMPAVAALTSQVRLWEHHASSAAAVAALANAAFFNCAPQTANYVHRGLAELQATVRGSSQWPGVGDYDLDSLYVAADEELSSP